MKYLACHEEKVRGTFDFPIELYYVDYANPRYEMPFHWHIECEFVLVLNGVLTLSLDGESIVLTNGDCAFINGGVIHGGIPQNCIYKCVVFDMERFLQDNIICRQKFSLVLGHNANIQNKFEKGSYCANIIDAVFEAIDKEQDGYEFITTGLLFEFIGIVIQQKLYKQVTDASLKTEKRASQMKNVLRRIRNDYFLPLTLDDLALEANMAPKYFCRVFHQVTGHTPIDYLNYYRIECAAELLCSTFDNVTEIALSCGFNELSYFIKTFKRYKNITPNAYRKVRRRAIDF
ncbi:AraC family transcriptional regulator [Paludicola sp. MB14-C6]|uniref:AraC family transcriptional regulator n=1 Tax=Paludihabitans sp. MB14-C6 TaxID=3070656 RepID=UPI0027DD5269|nr:AraC family transcriptional regulator [Paludicola sp. MB14-C6]WMJ22635.1 AraC family transcriptional regulator [Paludicola sp. MB14-C6]